MKFLSGIDVDTKTLFTDTANNRVGINITNAYATLAVGGNAIGGDASTCHSSDGIAWGIDSVAKTEKSNFAFGYGVVTAYGNNSNQKIANGPGQFVCGIYNVGRTKAIHRFAVGNGMNDETRHTAFCVTSKDYVGINKSNPTYNLDVSKDARIDGTVTASNFVLSSDKNLKYNIKDLNPAPIKVNWKSFFFNNNEGDYRTGVIAQELEETHPEFVSEDREGMKTVKYIDLLVAKIAELEDRLQKAGI
jgi:hypothetical protein